MGTLDSTLTAEDLELLIESLDDWELVGNQEYHIMHMVKNAPMPPQDHESFEMIKNVKEHFKQREKEINDTRKLRRERAIFLKAKLMLIRTDGGVAELFQHAQSASPSEPKQAAEKPSGDLAHKIERAEFFIKDVGIWEHYQKFLTEDGEKTA